MLSFLSRTRETTKEDYDASSIVWHLLRIARHAETRLEFEVHRPHGWSWSGFRVMANIYVMGPLRPAQLAEMLEVSRPTTTVTVQRLERAGLITRTDHPGSRSRAPIALTEDGRRAVESVVEPHQAQELALTSGLTSAELGQLARLLEKLYDSLQEAEIRERHVGPA